MSEMNKQAKVYWITGLSGSGKTTLCELLVAHLRKSGETVIKLDGDELRTIFRGSGHDRDSRKELAGRYGKLCRLLSSQGVNVAISTISLFHEVHNWNREYIPGYMEIYLDVPLEVVRTRDPKKIYERAEKGELQDVAGVDLKIEPPVNPDVVIKYEPGKKPGDILDELIHQLKRR